MQRLKWFILSIAVLLALTLFGAVASAQNGDALVRFVHVVPGAQAIDIYVDGQRTVAGLEYGQGTDYLSFPAGTYNVAVTQTGLTTTLWEQSITATADTASTLVASSISQLTFTVYTDSLAALDLGKARVTVIHALADGPSVDALIAGNRSVFPDLQYNTPTGTIDLDLSVEYPMAIVPANEGVENALIPEEVLPLTSGSLFTYIIYGTPNSPEKLLLSAPVTPSDNAGFVRLAHVIPGGQDVDVFFNDVRVATRVAFGATTQYIAASPDTYEVSIRTSGSGDSLAGANLTLDAGNYLSVVVSGSVDAPTLVPVGDDFSNVDGATALISVVNALPNSEDAIVALADGTELFSGVNYLDTGMTSTAPTDEAVSVSVQADGENLLIDLPAVPLHAGAYYTLVIYAGEEQAEAAWIDAVSVAQGIGSAPGDDSLGQVAQAPTAVPTEVPAVAAPTQSSEVTAETPAAPTAAPVVSSSSSVTATVVGLDPTANLRLRQYPNTGSYTLHLVSVGTVLTVNGREGAEIYPEGVATPTLAPEATAFVDPATLLTSRNQDLAPETTWLNITYNTPDGGTITAWALAQFLQVRDAEGASQRLADLPLIPRNRAGEAANTSITPPPDTQDRVTVVVIGINPGANLNLRRTADTAGEVLAPIPSGTVLEFLGVNQARTWVFVRYISLDGINYTGWVNLSFTQINLNDQPTTFDVLQARSLLVITPDDTRGTAEAGAPPVVAATRDPLRNVVVAEVTGVNPGANLNLRRTPNSQGEVLAPIPAGSLLVVLGRTEDTTWVEVSYEGQNGWVASQYVTLTFNGALVDINTLQVTSLRLTATPTPGA
ncbi:MAG: DUF4397 domain-containing protein [Anaerolineae bacterium]